MFNLLAEGQAVNWPLEVAKMVVPVILVLLGLWIWHLQKRSEPKYYLNQKRLDSLLKAWSLLAYITDTENSKAVLRWEKVGAETTYYLRLKQAREYIDALAEMFYANGYGLLLNNQIKELFYKYRSVLYSVLLRAKSEQYDEEQIKLDDDKLFKLSKYIYNNLNATLRKELKKIGK